MLYCLITVYTLRMSNKWLSIKRPAPNTNPNEANAAM
jgi:hypothetical protein